MTSACVKSVFDTVVERNPGEIEFHQAVHEVLASIDAVVPVLHRVAVCHAE